MRSMTESPQALFDEYAVRYARGEQPDPADYLRRAGDHANELAHAIDAFLATTPPPEPSTESIQLFRTWLSGASPLTQMRLSRDLEVDDVVDGLLQRLQLQQTNRTKLRRYYNQLEEGILDLKRVTNRLYGALAETLGTRTSELFLPQRGAADLRLAYLSQHRHLPQKQHEPAPERWDEVDQLFLGGP